MKVHLFRAKKFGWDEERDGIWFDTDQYTKEEAEAEFKPYRAVTQRGIPYTGYEYGGEKYHDFMYLGEFDQDAMPRSTNDYIQHLIKHAKK